MQSGYVNQIYKSRNIILDILNKRGFDVDDYQGSSISEVHSMYKNEQLDMLVSKSDKKVYVKYYLAKNSIRDTIIYEYIDDLFNIDNILEKKDDLIIITKTKPNDTIIKLLKEIYDEEKIFITIICIKNLQFNILNHTLVPPHKVLNKEEKNSVYTKYNIQSDSQVPTISRFDPVSLVIGLRPSQLCEITRPSKTSITSKFYRICSQ
jgi:DNA-directed RNA polymerase subunit H (RpoH/RPB5)